MLTWIVQTNKDNAKDIIAKIQGLGLEFEQNGNKLTVVTKNDEESINFLNSDI